MPVPTSSGDAAAAIHSTAPRRAERAWSHPSLAYPLTIHYAGSSTMAAAGPQSRDVRASKRVEGELGKAGGTDSRLPTFIRPR